MKFTLEQKGLLNPLRNVHGVADRHDPARENPEILTHTLIKAERAVDGQTGTIAFDACDAEVLYESERLTGTVEEEGKATVEAHLLYDFVSRIPGDATVQVRLTKKPDPAAGTVTDFDGAGDGESENWKTWVVFEAGGSKLELPSMNPGNFQEFAEPTGDPVRVPAAAFRHLVQSCRISMSDDEARLHLNGVFLHTTSENDQTLLRAAATDGHRLACSAHVLAGSDGSLNEGLTLPRKAVEQVSGLLQRTPDDVEVELRSGHDLAQLKVGSVLMTARLSQGGFPDYRRVIPEGLANRLQVNRSALEQAIDRVSAVVSKSPGIVFQISDGSLLLSGGDLTIGLGQERIQAAYQGEPLTIGFNAKYVLACCRVIPDREIIFELGAPSDAAVIRAPSDDTTVHVVMPMDVSGQRQADLLQEVGSTGVDAGARFTLPRSALLPPLSHLHHVVERVGTRPVLSHTLIQVDSGELTLNASDSQVLYETERLAVPVNTAGAATADMTTFHNVVGKLPEDADIRISATQVNEADAMGYGTWLVIETGQCKFILPSLPPADFPTLNEVEWTQHFELPVADLRRMLDWCRIAMSDDPARMHLNGMLLHVAEEDGQRLLRSGATDGHRLSQAGCVCPAGAESLGAGVTIPRKAVEQIGRLLAGADGGVQVRAGSGWMRFEIADTVVMTRLHESRFPDYQRVIPTECNSTLTIDTGVLRQALERLALVANRRSRAIRFELSENRLAAMGGDQQHGVGRETLFSGNYRGSPVVVGFRSEYVIEFCQAARSDEVIMEFPGSGKPVVIRDTSGAGRLHVIMPTLV